MKIVELNVSTRGLVMVEYEAYDGDWDIECRLLGFFASQTEAEAILADTVPTDWDREAEPGVAFSFTPITLGISPERMSVAYANAEVRRLRTERGLKA